MTTGDSMEIDILKCLTFDESPDFDTEVMKYIFQTLKKYLHSRNVKKVRKWET